jgi:hypothetical protein
MSRLRTILVVAAGLVMIASSAAHSLLGWPPLAGVAYLAFAAGAAAFGFDFIEVVFLTPGVLLTAAALVRGA